MNESRFSRVGPLVSCRLVLFAAIAGLFCAEADEYLEIPVVSVDRTDQTTTVSFVEKSFHRYELHASDDLISWEQLPMPVVGDEPGKLRFIVHSTETANFYRLRIEPLEGPDYTLHLDPRFPPPESALSGDGTAYTLLANIGNAGTEPAPAGGVITAEVLLRNVETEEETLLTTFPNLNVNRLQPAQAYAHALRNILLPPVPTASYAFVVRLLRGDESGDISTANNESITDAFAVEEGISDIVPKIGAAASFPVLAFPGSTIDIPIEIENSGNLTLSSTQAIAVDVVALQDGTKTTVARFENQSVARLAARTVRPLLLRGVIIPEGFDGAYRLGVEIDTLDQLAEKNEENNAVELPQSMTVARPLSRLRKQGNL